MSWETKGSRMLDSEGLVKRVFWFPLPDFGAGGLDSMNDGFVSDL